MGSIVELNDTLQITTEQGFPAMFDLEKHREKPFTLADVEGKTFSFHGKKVARIYHHSPTRCFLVHNIDGKWLYWGKILITSQTITGRTPETHETAGEYVIIDVYDPEYQEMITKRETSPGKSYL